MLPAIEHHHQRQLYAGKIDNELADPMLSPKLATCEVPIAQDAPHNRFGAGRISA